MFQLRQGGSLIQGSAKLFRQNKRVFQVNGAGDHIVDDRVHVGVTQR